MTTTREVIPFERGSFERRLDRELQKTLETAGLMEDADEVIACLMESPRFKSHLRKAAEAHLAHTRARLELVQKSVEAAEEELRRVSEDGA